jgi:RNA polymerase sigma-70 factor (ECF subfamily)
LIKEIQYLLIEELKKGSPKAFRALVERFSHDVVNTCYSFVNSRDDAEDIAQEVFIEIYKSIRQFRKESDLNTWIYRISINKSLDFLRAQKRKKRIADLKSLFIMKNRSSKSSHQQLEEKERKKILQEQIALLPENQRITMVLSQYERKSNKQIAEILKTSESAVESLLHRARTNLRKNLEKYFKKNL